MFTPEELKERCAAYDKKRLAAKRAADPMTRIQSRSEWLDRQREEGKLSQAEWDRLQTENWQRC